MGRERVVRHHLADRLYHWTMAAALLTCLFTAFLPILGWKFAWVTAHWIAGIVLTAVIVFHIVRAVIWQDFWSMVIGPRDVRAVPGPGNDGSLIPPGAAAPAPDSLPVA